MVSLEVTSSGNKFVQEQLYNMCVCCPRSPPGTLDVRLMGCQDLLENVPGRSKAASVPLPGWSPSETRSSFISRANRNRGVSSRNLTKSEELSSKYIWSRTQNIYRKMNCDIVLIHKQMICLLKVWAWPRASHTWNYNMGEVKQLPV